MCYVNRRRSTFWRSTLSAPNGALSMPYWPNRSAWQKSNRCWSSFIHAEVGMQLNRSSFYITCERYEKLTGLGSNCGGCGTTLLARFCRKEFPTKSSSAVSTPIIWTLTIFYSDWFRPNIYWFIVLCASVKKVGEQHHVFGLFIWPSVHMALFVNIYFARCDLII